MKPPHKLLSDLSEFAVQGWTREMEKRVQARIQYIVTDPALLSVLQKFGGDVFRRSSVFHGLNAFLTKNEVRGKLCFEIGTWNGLTAIVLSRFFEWVVSVDIVDNPIKNEIVQHLGIRNIRFFTVKDNNEKAKVAAQFPFDFAYMDGNHADDTALDWDMVKRCGRVLFHEFWPFQPPVWNLVQSLPRSQITANGDGLALWDSHKIVRAVLEMELTPP